MKSATFSVVLLFAIVQGLEPPEITTNFGVVRGKWRRTVRSSLVATFLGIPYAEPPIGLLRFEKTRPWTKVWRKTRSAILDGPQCPQLDEKDNLVGNENCLFLNIFMPYIENGTIGTKQDEKLPVIVFLHAGAFTIGSNNSTRHGPEYLLDQNVILITVNYRLNFLGFFSTGNSVAPGNNGLKDVVMSLRWVQNNIGNFGGDSGSVTLHGQSAGAVIAQLLSFSNKTEGLFHKIILQSESVLGAGAFQTRKMMRHFSLELARLAGCSRELDNDIFPNDEANVTEHDEMLQLYYDEMREWRGMTMDMTVKNCMKNRDLKTLFNHSRFFHVWNGLPWMVFVPTLEAERKDAVVTTHPVKVLEDGTFRDIPVIIGDVQDEGLGITYDILKDENLTLEMVRNFSTLMPVAAHGQQLISDTKEFTHEITNYFFHGNVAKYFVANITQVLSDFVIVWPIHKVLSSYFRNMNSSVYYYTFSYEGTISDTKQKDFPLHYTVGHGDDHNYLFPDPAQIMDPGSHTTPNDQAMVRIMTELFGSFTKNGTPSASLTPDWEPYQKHRKFMRLGNGRSPYGSMEEDTRASRMGFWHELMNNVSFPLTEFVVTDDLPAQEIDLHSAGTRVSNNEHIFIGLFSATFIIPMMIHRFII